MMSANVKEWKHQLSVRLERLDVPPLRKDLSKPENIRWLSRNLWINNSKKPDAREAMRLIVRLIKASYQK